MSDGKESKEDKAVEMFKMKKLIKSLENARGCVILAAAMVFDEA